MVVERLFGSSGIRRRFDRSLIDLAVRAGAALACGRERVVLGRDTRTTSPLMADALKAGAIAAGLTVEDGGIAPTPSVAWSTRQRDAGCMITASHNPEPYNGIKLINPDGSSFTKEQQHDLERQLAEVEWSDWSDQGDEDRIDILTPHLSAIQAAHPISIEDPVVVDCGNGAGSVITPRLLSGQGVAVHAINCHPARSFVRPSEPLEVNLPYLPGMIRKLGARCGIVHDGDADRMMAFDSTGRFIRGDHLLILFARYLGARRVVTTDDASMAVEEFAEVRRTPVGDTCVSEELRRWGDFGGEPSGSWIFPEYSLCPDGIRAAAIFCEMASEWDIPAEIDAMPEYRIIRESVVVEDPRSVLEEMGAEDPSRGLRLEEEDGWCLVRASGTEPKVRLTAEGRDRRIAEKMLQKARNLLKRAKDA
ncbi:MAG: phosphopentomutase/phosphoglucosamine mutase [Methanoculleaceae archaeon]